MRVAVLTTSYPRSADDVAGSFVRDAVEHLREAGVKVEVVSPATFRHFGIAYGDGIAGNLRRRPWLVLALPLFLLSYALAARRAARGADLVHAHWLPSALPALATGKPFVVQLWGTDAEPDVPPHVLFVGRLSEEKGIRELVEATNGVPRVIVGDGPLRDEVPDAVGFVSPSELGSYYERAAVVACPSRREGYGMVAREAMAYGRPVVATAVGGLGEAVEDGVTGLVVPPCDPVALRAAVERLLEDPELRRRCGEAARGTARRELSWDRATSATVAAYRSALGS